MSADKRRRIAYQAALHGYKPRQTRRGVLSGLRIGYEIPRVWSSSPSVNTIFAAQAVALVTAVEELGGELSPFVIDPRIRDFTDGSLSLANGRPPSPADHQDFLMFYATTMAGGAYRALARERKLRGFFVDDPRDGDERLAALQDGHIPFVVIGRPTKSASRHPAFAVDTDDGKGLEEVCRQLKDIVGCKAFGHFGFARDKTQVPVRRGAAVKRALKESLITRHTKHYEDFDEQRAVQDIEAWLREYPRLDAVVADCDYYASLVARAAPGAGRVISRRLDCKGALVLGGCDDAPARQASPVPWISLRQPALPWATAAAKLMAEAVDGRLPRLELVSAMVVDGYEDVRFE
jgi:DNA-binding LacI/PurR family transcriptional regulator